MRFSFLAAVILATSALATAQSAAPWDYAGKHGPLGWGKLDPAYRACSQGHEQSPIDLRGAHLNKTLEPIQFHYISGPVTLENDGHTIVAKVNSGSYIVADGVRYELVEFDFHHPSEEAVQGKLTDMDVHMLHKSADGKFAAIAVRMSEDRDSPNAVLAMLWPHIPKTPMTSEKVPDMVNVGGFLPTDRGYWTYTGSLTAPPCTEGVRWFVFEEAVTVNREQLRSFTALFRMNSRPLQDTHGRRIEANE